MAFGVSAYSQVDSTRTRVDIGDGIVEIEQDSQVVMSSDIQFKSPSAAALYSAIFPGLGQIYNGKYWKLPIVYGAIGAGVYSITWNQKNYNVFLEAYRIRKNGGIDDYINILKTEDQLISWMDYYRNNRDLSILLTTLAYTFTILDAYVDAHLINFTINDDLSMRIEPSTFPEFHSQNLYAYGVKLRFDF